MKKHNLIIIIATLVLLGLSICGYLIYSNTTNKNENNTIEEDNTPVEEKTILTEENFDEVVKDSYGLGVLTNKQSLDEMTNQERLRLLIHLYRQEEPDSTTFSKETLEEIHNNSVIKNLDVIYEDLYDYYGTFKWNTSSIAYAYNAEDETFTYTGALGHGGIAEGNIAHSEILSISKPGNEYIVRYRFIFYNTLGDGPTDENLYLNVNDALNKTNEWTHLALQDDNLTHKAEYIEEHYEEVKDNLPVYTYTFSYEDEHLVITNFSVEE